MSPRHVREDCNPAGPRKIAASLAAPLTEEDWLRMLQGIKNGLLLELPFWLGLIYRLTR